MGGGGIWGGWTAVDLGTRSAIARMFENARGRGLPTCPLSEFVASGPVCK